MSDLRSIIRPADGDAWTVAEGSIDGRRSALRYRGGLAGVLGHPALPLRLLISWHYCDDGESGMPADSVEAEMAAFERTLHDALDPQRAAVLAFVFTHIGAREWHYYVGDLDLVGDTINAALADQPELPISIKAFDDPEWTELGTLLKRIKPAP
jgi:hypothetical protein